MGNDRPLLTQIREHLGTVVIVIPYAGAVKRIEISSTECCRCDRQRNRLVEPLEASQTDTSFVRLIGMLITISTTALDALSSAGHQVHVQCPSLNLQPSERRTLTYNGVTVTRFGAHKRVDDTLVDWFELVVGEHKRIPFDVLHAYFLTQAGFVAAYTGNYLKLPSIVSIRGNDIERAPFDPTKFSHVMCALQNASALTTNANELLQNARAFFDREITLIPNGINTTLFKPLEKTTF